MANRVFVTGFGPFGSTTKNPSAVLAAACGAAHRVLEVSWEAVDEWLASGEADGFDVILHIGLAAGRRQLTPELFAHNAIGKTPDVLGVVRKGKIERYAPRVVGSTLWTPEMLASLMPEKRLKVSDDAGRYLCNYIGYRSLRRFPDKRVGFLHVPKFKHVGEERQLRVLRAVLASLA